MNQLRKNRKKRSSSTKEQLITELMEAQRGYAYQMTRTVARRMTVAELKKVLSQLGRRRPAKKKRRAAPRKKKSSRRNPGGGVLIGDDALSLTYRGGRGKKKKSRWIHKFETPVEVLGLRDGSIKLRSKQGLALWDFF